MAMYHHDNLLPLLASFTDGNELWLVVPYIDHGSVQNILKYKFRDGLSEDLIAIVIFETLKGLAYLHHHGMMHRDVKAGNVLVDSDGHVYLADFGVAAPMEPRGGSWSDKPRNTFVGTPCWMAPEVMQVCALCDVSCISDNGSLLIFGRSCQS
jgi:serine/threonine-protein kinase OSR1/STK39